MKLTKEEYIEALVLLGTYGSDCSKCSYYSVENDRNYRCSKKETCVESLLRLIEDCFDHDTTPDIQHFKVYSDSTLKSWKKDELIEYINTLYHNWQNTCWYHNNAVAYGKKLLQENKKLTEQLAKATEGEVK